MHGAANKVYSVPLHTEWMPDPQDPMGPGILFVNTFDAHGFEHGMIPAQLLEVQFGPFRPRFTSDLVPKQFMQDIMEQVQCVLHLGYSAGLAQLYKEGKVAVRGAGQLHRSGITRYGKALNAHETEYKPES